LHKDKIKRHFDTSRDVSIGLEMLSIQSRQNVRALKLRRVKYNIQLETRLLLRGLQTTKSTRLSIGAGWKIYVAYSANGVYLELKHTRRLLKSTFGTSRNRKVYFDKRVKNVFSPRIPTHFCRTKKLHVGTAGGKSLLYFWDKKSDGIHEAKSHIILFMDFFVCRERMDLLFVGEYNK